MGLALLRPQKNSSCLPPSTFQQDLPGWKAASFYLLRCGQCYLHPVSWFAPWCSPTIEGGGREVWLMDLAHSALVNGHSGSVISRMDTNA